MTNTSRADTSASSLVSMTVGSWLSSLQLDRYISAFEAAFLTSMERVVDIWDDELTSILEVSSTNCM